MTLAVTDTGPIHYLILIQAVDVLPRLFDRLVIPQAVHDELSHPHAPASVRAWISTLPPWAEVMSPTQLQPGGTLGIGEIEAIALATELRASAVLLDETEARDVAIRLGLPVTGTVGLLEKAAQRGWLTLSEAFERLLKTSFRITQELVKQALARDAGRQASPAGQAKPRASQT